MIGEVVDGHEILQALGAGGMGEVYLARDARGGLRALKIVRPDQGASAQAAGRFRREALALGKLHHPNIIQIREAGQLESGALYLMMEYAAGPDLQAAISWNGPYAVGDALKILVQLAAALAYAHYRGVVHRDLKPANVILADGDPTRAKIIDFGLAKLLGDEGLTQLTADDQVVGSPTYWAPEQSSTADVGPAADVYALGGLAYFLLSGEPMFSARPSVAMVYAHVNELPEPLSVRCRDVVLPGLDEVVASCVAKAPADRPLAEQLVFDLDRLLVSAPAQLRARRSQRLFTGTNQTNLEQAITSQLRQVLLELAAVLGRPIDVVEQVQAELSDVELELAMLEADEATDPEVARKRQATATTVARLQGALADAFSGLFNAVEAERANATAEVRPLFAELDGLVDRL